MIYLGFFISVLFYPVIRKIKNRDMPSIWLLIIPVILLAADTIPDILDIYKNSFLTRSITGFIIGFVLPLFLIPGVVNFIYGAQKVFQTKK